MELPVLSAEQKLAIREAQIKFMGLQMTLRDVQSQLQVAQAQLLGLIMETEATFGLKLNPETLSFIPKAD